MVRLLLLLVAIFNICFYVSGLWVNTVEASPRLEKIATSEYQWTGVSVTGNGRVFVNFPTWNDYPADYCVAELINGKEVPYPDKNWNQEFICVQSVVADREGHLWILDPAKLRGKEVSPTGAKLYDVELASNQVKRVYVFPPETALPQSYLNDVRIDTKRRMAYMTDSGLGGIVVLDLDTGDSWRALEGIAEVRANLPYIDFVSTGRNDHVSQSDGIELSEDGDILYFTALGGDILYQIPTALLWDRELTVKERQKGIEVLTYHNVPTDGMILRKGKLIMANLPEEKIWEFDLRTKTGKNLDLPESIRWADSFSLAADDSVYFTTSQINYPLQERKAYELYRLVLDE